ncbi:MAG: hypothetical protein K2W82_17625 [Candidatus Obscuribacterales bacterium]|jgi:hypothetical protein|nr:hypothetical protein [Candidatus Obscuribacterales bacterium]
MSGYVSRAKQHQDWLIDRIEPEQEHLDSESESECLGIIFESLRKRLGKAIIAQARPGEIWVVNGLRHNLVLSAKGTEFCILVTVRPQKDSNKLQFSPDDIDKRRKTLDSAAMEKAIARYLRK